MADTVVENLMLTPVQAPTPSNEEDTSSPPGEKTLKRPHEALETENTVKRSAAAYKAHSSPAEQSDIQTLGDENNELKQILEELSDEFSRGKRNCQCEAAVDDIRSLLDASIADHEMREQEFNDKLKSLEAVIEQQRLSLEHQENREKELSSQLATEISRANTAETLSHKAQLHADSIEKERISSVQHMESDVDNLKRECSRLLDLLRKEQEEECQDCLRHLQDLSNTQTKIDKLEQEGQKLEANIQQLQSKHMSELSDIQAEKDGYLSDIQRLREEIADLMSVNEDFQDQIRQFGDDLNKCEKDLSDQRLEYMGKEEELSIRIIQLQNSYSAHQTESASQVRKFQEDLRVVEEKLVRITQHADDLIRQKKHLEHECSVLRESNEQKDQHISREEIMVNVLRKQLEKKPDRETTLDSDFHNKMVMDFSGEIDGQYTVPTFTVSDKVLGKRRQVNQSVTQTSKNPFLAMLNNGSINDKTSGPSHFSVVITSLQLNALGAPSIPYSSLRNATNAQRVSPGRAQDNPRLRSQTPHLNGPLTTNTTPKAATSMPSRSATQARVYTNQSYGRTSVGRSRACTPGPSNPQLGRISESSPFSSPNCTPGPSSPYHASNNPNGIQSEEVSYGITNLLAQTLVQGMDRMTRAIGDLHTTVLENANIKSPLSRTKGFSPFKTPSPRKPRSKDSLILMGNIRRVMNEMLGIKQDQDIVKAVQNGHFVTQDVADSLADADVDEEIIQDNLLFMKPFWATLKCDYNALLCRLFTDHFIATYQEYEEQEDRVEKHFTQRLSSLRYYLSKNTSQPGETDEATVARNGELDEQRRRNKRIRQRQREGYRRRVNDLQRLAEVDPSYEAALNVICSLGADGYSSDESGAEGGGYLVHHLPWRSRMVNPIIQQAIDAHPTVNINGNNLPGGQMRRRIYHTYPPVSTTPAPAGLLRNLYDDIWFNGLSYANKQILNAGPDIPLDNENMDED